MSHALILNVRHGGAAAVPEGHRKFVRSGRSGKNHAVSRWLGAEVHCSTARVVSGAPANRTTAQRRGSKPMAALLITLQSTVYLQSEAQRKDAKAAR
jgi:hypothetical protein